MIGLGLISYHRQGEVQLDCTRELRTCAGRDVGEKGDRRLVPMD
jgi:hypothetical protein